MNIWTHVFEDRRVAHETQLARSARSAGRRTPIAIRGHNAAKVDRLTADWPSAPVPTDSMLLADLQKLRARSRWEAENDDYASRFLALLETNVIGEPGIRPSPQIVTQDGKPDVAMNEAISRAWLEWGGTSKLCDMGRRMTWHELERLFIRTAAEDGEVVVQEVRGRSAGPFGYALHFVDAELLDVQYSEGLLNGRYSRLGIQLDEWHRPVGYWLKGDQMATSSVGYNLGAYYGADSKLWSADDIIHSFVSKRIGQKRGLPWMSTSLFRMRQLSGLEDSAAVSARVGAAQMGFIEREAGEADPPYDDEEGDGGPRIIETEPGIFMEGRPGEKLANFHPAYPNEMFDPFVQSILRGISSGLNVGYNTLANNGERTSYSAMRSMKSDDNDAWRVLQRWTSGSFHQRVYTNWLEMAAMSGKIQPVDGRTVGAAEARAMAEMVEWDPRGWEAIDHDKDSKSNERDVTNGLRSRQEIAAARGRKWDRVFRELVEEHQMMVEAGLPVAAAPAAPADSDALRDAVTDVINELNDEGED